jgi:hypothetical protein
LALTSPTSGGRSVGIVRLLTKATDFSSFYHSIIQAVVLKLNMVLLPFTVLLVHSVCLTWTSHIALEHVVRLETSDAAKMQHKQ